MMEEVGGGVSVVVGVICEMTVTFGEAVNNNGERMMGVDVMIFGVEDGMGDCMGTSCGVYPVELQADIKTKSTVARNCFFISILYILFKCDILMVSKDLVISCGPFF